MARKPRKKLPKILILWEMETDEIIKIVTHLREKFPTSGQLVRYEKELTRRENNEPVEIINE